jgi:hypothetical protein
MSTDIDVKSSQWKQVEVGRVVLFTDGPYSGRLAAIVEIVDHKRVSFPRLARDISLKSWNVDCSFRSWLMDHRRICPPFLAIPLLWQTPL